jgi:general secretion pathway protein C
MNAVSWFDGFATPDKWRGSLQSRAPQVAVWVLALAIGVQAAIIVTNFAGTATAPTLSNAQSSVPVATQQPARRADVAAIANSHIFGAPAPPEQPPQDAANAPQTSMPLVLTGIISNEDPQNGLAILGESAASAKVYGVGDNLPGGAKLHSVYSDRVLLDRNGQLESLALPRQIVAGMMPIEAAPTLPSAPPQEPLADRMRRLIAEEPGVISDVMRPQAVFAQGKQRGYRVYPGRNRQAFLRLGLRPGDLVVSINGTPLDDPARGQEIFRTIGSSSEAHVTVMRNGRQQDLTLNMSQVASEAEQLVGGEGSMAPADQQPQVPPQPDMSGND